MKLWISVLFFLLLSSFAEAQVFTLPTLSSSDTDPVFRTLASDFAFRPVQPASDMGLWGGSIGVSGTMASTSQISYLNPGTSDVYSADISGALQLPFGVAVEAGFLPGVSLSNTTMNQFGMDVKWTITRDFLEILPFDLALRGMYTNASISYSQTVSGAPATVNYTGNLTGATLSLSKDLLILNPYIGYGFIQHNSTLSSSSSGLFGSGFAGGTTTTSGSGASGWLQIGAQLKLGFMTLAAEYDNMFTIDSYTARVGLAF